MKRFIKALLIFSCIFLLVGLSACKQDEVYTPSRVISVVLLNGNHYSVLGNNKQFAENGGTITFEIELERGYKAIDSFGDSCSISDNLSFRQTVKFTNVKYNMTAQIETEPLPASDFEVCCQENMGEIGITSVLGAAANDSYYDCDIVNLAAVPKTGHRFVCWSSGNYISNGGAFYGYDPNIENVDFVGLDNLYANFKDITNTKNTLVYRLDNGIEVEQDCSVQMEHHYRANTLTAKDMRDKGVDCDSKMLTGWTTVNGEYVGLGSRIATDDKEVILFPIWKDYTSSEYFTVEDGVLVGFSGTPDADGVIVIPNEVGGEKVTAIGENAFENCSAEIYYVPDTVVTVKENAFLNCVNLKEFYMSDNIVSITDEAFKGCLNFHTLHISAYLKPRYTTEEVSVVAENYDRLAANTDSGMRKLVVLGGSGTQSSYSCSVISEMFEEIGEPVDVYNFGWSAAYCGLAQFEVINGFLKADDIFLHAPEQYEGVLCGEIDLSPLTNEKCIALTKGNPYLYRFAEINWDFVSKITVNQYANLFSMFTAFNEYRIKYLPEREYSDCCSRVVEEGYGYRPTNEQVFNENGTDKSFAGARDIISFTSHFEFTKKYIYENIVDGVITYVTFPAINRANLILTYGNEGKVKEVSAEYTKQVKDILSGLNLEVLLSQYDTVYDGRYFYNHDYHLGYPSRDAHTQKVISALIERFKLREVHS